MAARLAPPPGNTRAWAIVLDGSSMWMDDPQGVVDHLDCVVGDGVGSFDREEALRRTLGMNPGDTYEAGDFTIECHMVAEGWVETLPEHPGW